MRHVDRVCRPCAVARTLGNERGGRPLQRAKIEKHVLRRAHDRRGATELAARLLEVCRRQQLATAVALVAARIRIAAQWTLALDEAIGEKALARLAVELVDRLLGRQRPSVKSPVVDACENVLSVRA